MSHVCSVTHSPEPYTDYFLSQINPVHKTLSYFFNMCVNIIFPPTFIYSKRFVSYKFSHQSILALLFFALGSSCPIHIILPDVINQIITNEQCILWLFLLCGFRQSHIAACQLVPNISRLTYKRIYFPVRSWHK
jgi:hypothetical protein